ncbi:MAG: hypothetical protein K0R14_1063 [Burkholderiales bacterium]|jgi:hypothetical protein|nr:hypothetical protein [Burkholderiales bacterium]
MQIFKIVSDVIDKTIARKTTSISSLAIATIFFMVKPIMPTIVDEISTKLHFKNWTTLNIDHSTNIGKKKE